MATLPRALLSPPLSHRSTRTRAEKRSGGGRAPCSPRRPSTLMGLELHSSRRTAVTFFRLVDGGGFLGPCRRAGVAGMRSQPHGGPDVKLGGRWTKIRPLCRFQRRRSSFGIALRGAPNGDTHTPSLDEQHCQSVRSRPSHPAKLRPVDSRGLVILAQRVWPGTSSLSDAPVLVEFLAFTPA